MRELPLLFFSFITIKVFFTIKVPQVFFKEVSIELGLLIYSFTISFQPIFRFMLSLIEGYRLVIYLIPSIIKYIYKLYLS